MKRPSTEGQCSSSKARARHLLDHGMYHLDLFIAGFRVLLLFYLPMFLAGYAQSTDVHVFWGCWAALMLLLWEPYLSPPFPWISPDDSPPDESSNDAAADMTGQIQMPEGKDFGGTSCSATEANNIMDAGVEAAVEAHHPAAANHDVVGGHHDTCSTSSSSRHRGGLDQATGNPLVCLPTETESDREHAEMRERQRKQRRHQQVDAWKRAVARSVPAKQHMIYRLLHMLLIAPVVAVVMGVATQHAGCSKMDKTLAACPGGATLHYSSDLLAALLLLYLVLVLSSCALFVVFIVPDLKPSHHWQPQDMLFFICKVLGSALNTIVQTLVAGSFVAYMTTRAFWLCMAITGMSYVATDLLYDMGGDAPVGELWGPLGVLTSSLKPKGPQSRRSSQKSSSSCRTRSSKRQQCSAASGQLLPVLSMSGNTSIIGGSNMAAMKPAAAVAAGTGDISGAAAAAAAAAYGSGDAVSGKPVSVAAGAAAAGAHGMDSSSSSSSDAGGVERAPFLVYRKPYGWRGFSIIALLVVVSAPCIAILVQLQKPESLMVPGSGCEGDCAKRYVQLLYALCSMGLLSCYYSLTVGCIGMGPVELLFVLSKRAWRK